MTAKLTLSNQRHRVITVALDVTFTSFNGFFASIFAQILARTEWRHQQRVWFWRHELFGTLLLLAVSSTKHWRAELTHEALQAVSYSWNRFSRDMYVIHQQTKITFLSTELILYNASKASQKLISIIDLEQFLEIMATLQAILHYIDKTTSEI